MHVQQQTDVREPAPVGARRVLVAVHGREPAGWEYEVVRAVALETHVTVEILAVSEVPSPPFTSLLPAARRAHARARAGWRRLEEESVARRLEILLRCLPTTPAVVWVRVTDGDPGRGIAEQAAARGADLIVVGVDRTSWLRRRLLGAIHERVVARAGCGVLVMPPPERDRPRVAESMPTSSPGGRPAAAKGGA